MKRFINRSNFNAAVGIAVLVAACGLPACEAAADSRFPPVTNARWQEECGSCHLAYQPQLLPAANWRGIMSHLDKHFGADASLDAASAAAIGRFLESNAASGKRAAVDAGTLRISETPWFQRKHREVAPSVWKSAAVKTPANCGACHTTAGRGDYGERNIRIPR